MLSIYYMLLIENNTPIQFAIIELQDVMVDLSPTPFNHLQLCARQYQEKYSTIAISEIPGVQVAREFFRAIGIDPTKRRPSSEALLNRALKNKELFSVNSLVDVGNWCSLEFLLPICIYDAGNIKGPIHLRMGRMAESYLALNGQEIHLDGRYVLADEIGPFGSPITDSLRTAVDLGTKQALLGIFAPKDYDSLLLKKQGDLFANRAVEICGGSIVYSQITKSTD